MRSSINIIRSPNGIIGIRNDVILTFSQKTSESFQFLGGSLKKEADETLFLELALRGYDLSGLLRENTETDETTAEIVKTG